MRNVVLTFIAVSVLSGGILSWYASENPDGLEWSIEKVTGKGEIEGEKAGVHKTFAGFQEKLAFLPDYSFKKNAVGKNGDTKPVETSASHTTGVAKEEKKEEGSKLGTSVSGIIGGLLTLGMAFAIGIVLKRKKHPA